MNLGILGSLIQNIQNINEGVIKDFRKLRGNISIQILLNPMDRRGVDIVNDIISNPHFIEDKKSMTNPNNIDVIVDSFGGDADASYHIAKMLHKNFSGKITYIIPRFAKSAATLLICGGNSIVMGQTSELGPLDPQIPQGDGTYISAKAVQATLELIKHHLKDKSKDGLQLATILASRINPLVLGQYESTLDIAQEYQKELLLLRMFNDKKKVKTIVSKFAIGYTHHSRVINAEEAQEILGTDKVEIWQSDKQEWKLLWQFYQNNRNIADVAQIMKNVDINFNR